MLREIRKQQDLLGADASKCKVDFLSDTHQRHGTGLSCDTMLLGLLLLFLTDVLRNFSLIANATEIYTTYFCHDS